MTCCPSSKPWSPNVSAMGIFLISLLSKNIVLLDRSVWNLEIATTTLVRNLFFPRYLSFPKLFFPAYLVGPLHELISQSFLKKLDEAHQFGLKMYVDKDERPAIFSGPSLVSR